MVILWIKIFILVIEIPFFLNSVSDALFCSG